MDRIQIGLLQQPTGESMAAMLARMTQRGHKISSLDDLYELKNKPASDGLKQSLSMLPHGTVKRFDSFTVAIVGASRRFLAQIRTHQHADFVSGSLQYSDWSESYKEDMFVIPYEMFDNPNAKTDYLMECYCAFDSYRRISGMVGNDAAGFVMPNGLRNVLIIQANVQSWQYMIQLRACRRNSLETRYIMLRIWEELLTTEVGNTMFNPKYFGITCTEGGCREGKFCCSKPYKLNTTPTEILHNEFPLLYKE